MPRTASMRRRTQRAPKAHATPVAHAQRKNVIEEDIQKEISEGYADGRSEPSDFLLEHNTWRSGPGAGGTAVSNLLPDVWMTGTDVGYVVLVGLFLEKLWKLQLLPAVILLPALVVLTTIVVGYDDLLPREWLRTQTGRRCLRLYPSIHLCIVAALYGYRNAGDALILIADVLTFNPWVFLWPKRAPLNDFWAALLGLSVIFLCRSQIVGNEESERSVGFLVALASTVLLIFLTLRLVAFDSVKRNADQSSGAVRGYSGGGRWASQDTRQREERGSAWAGTQALHRRSGSFAMMDMNTDEAPSDAAPSHSSPELSYRTWSEALHETGLDVGHEVCGFVSDTTGAISFALVRVLFLYTLYQTLCRLFFGCEYDVPRDYPVLRLGLAVWDGIVFIGTVTKDRAIYWLHFLVDIVGFVGRGLRRLCLRCDDRGMRAANGTKNT